MGSESRRTSDARPPTPRAQVARVVVAGTLAVVLGAGPAVAWDLSTQLPTRDGIPPAARKASPWRGAGRELKDAAAAIARVYLPSTAVPSASAPSTVVAPAVAPPPTASFAPPPPPHLYHHVRPAPEPAMIFGGVE
jgi:hypothetical protein